MSANGKLIFSSLENKAAQETFKIFYSTADKESQWDSIPGTGDVDFTRVLEHAANKKSPGSAEYIRNIYDENEIYAHIEKNRNGRTPILHIFRNGSKFGSAFSVEGLKKFKANGGIVIMTAVEFERYGKKQDGIKLKLEILRKLKVVDRIIFEDHIDKKDAMDTLEQYADVLKQQVFKKNPEKSINKLRKKLAKAKIIHVPPTILIDFPSDIKERGRDIISFGVLRPLKGFAHIRNLAEIIKANAHNPLMKDKKILVVGSTFDKYPNNQELYKFVVWLYPTQTQKIDSSIQGPCDHIGLKKLLQEFNALEAAGKLKPAFPLELHLDVPEQELGRLFARARYSFLPCNRGANLRFTSFGSSLAESRTGLVTISHVGHITPKELLPKGAFENAMVLMPDDEFATYAKNVFLEIERREKNPALNMETCKVASRLMSERLDLPVIYDQHLSIYRKLNGKLNKKVVKQDLQAATLNPFVQPNEGCINSKQTKTFQPGFHEVFVSSANTEISGIGDVDYATAVVDGMNQTAPGRCVYLKGIHKEHEIYAHIEKHKATKHPVLHIMNNRATTGAGSVFTTEGLRGFKTTGGKVVMTPIEFAKYSDRGAQGHAAMKELISYLDVADEAIFLDEFDKQSALDTMMFLYGNQKQALAEKIKRALVIAVPPTVIIEAPKAEREGHVISFGMIRPGKGLAHLRKLALLMQNSSDPKMNKRKVFIVGTALEPPKEDQAHVDKVLFRPNEELYKLMVFRYPHKIAEIHKAIGKAGFVNKGDVRSLKVLLKEFQAEENKQVKEQQGQKPEVTAQYSQAKPVENMEIHLDVSEQELARLFARAKYSFLPAFRGATLRNSSISCSLSQSVHGLVTICHYDDITPTVLRKKGEHEKAMVFMPEGSDNYFGQKEYTQDGYAGMVFEEIQRREKDPKLNQETLEAARRLTDQCLSRKVVGLAHLALYDQMLEEHQLHDASVDDVSIKAVKGRVKV